jgi:hypothetical protein
VILEGIVTTLHANGTVNISPMGPDVDDPLGHLVLKPYQTSTTYQNLKRTGQGVFHVTDDVELIARAAVGELSELPPMVDCPAVEGRILSTACRWYAFRVMSLDDTNERTRIECQVVQSGWLRDFFGFNRAKHAVLEAAILATRIDFVPHTRIREEFARWEEPLRKTGGAAEWRAFDFLSAFVRERCSEPRPPRT